ncbi:MAG: nucleoside-diphosphate sugar epimerase [Pseudomonadota bacterium]
MARRTVIIAGASGLVGRELLQGLLAEPTVAAVHSLGRRPLDVQHAKLQTYLTDFKVLPRLPAADEAYLALGSTKKAAGSQAAFRAVDHDATLAVAAAALAAGVTKMRLVRVIGADQRSAFFYSRMKGEVEMLGHAVNRLFGFCIPRNFKPIRAATVARVLLSAVPTATGRSVLLLGEMR